MKPELTLAGIPRLDPPDCGEAEHKAAQGNPPHRYIALDRVVMQGQVFICRAPSHEKAKKLARMFNAWPVVVSALSEAEFLFAHGVAAMGDNSTGNAERNTNEGARITRQVREAIQKAEAV